MTQPESRTVEERLAAVIREVFRARVSVVSEALALAILAAAKEHGLVIGEGELGGLRELSDAASRGRWHADRNAVIADDMYGWDEPGAVVDDRDLKDTDRDFIVAAVNYVRERLRR